MKTLFIRIHRLFLFRSSFHQSNHNQPSYYVPKNEGEPFAAVKEYRLPQRVSDAIYSEVDDRTSGFFSFLGLAIGFNQ